MSNENMNYPAVCLIVQRTPVQGAPYNEDIKNYRVFGTVERAMKQLHNIIDNYRKTYPNDPLHIQTENSTTTFDANKPETFDYEMALGPDRDVPEERLLTNIIINNANDGHMLIQTIARILLVEK